MNLISEWINCQFAEKRRQEGTRERELGNQEKYAENVHLIFTVINLLLFVSF